MRTLTWYVPGPLSEVEGETDIAVAHVLDQDYRPVAVHLHLKTASVSGVGQFDINDDGTSLFDSPPDMDKGQTLATMTTFLTANIMEEGSAITLDADTVGVGQAGLSVHLDLEEVVD